MQIGIILIVFPLLLLLRRRLAPVGLWVGIVVAACVAIVGLYWFVERIFALVWCSPPRVPRPYGAWNIPLTKEAARGLTLVPSDV